MGKRLTNEQFIERARARHGDKYNYSRTKYVDSITKVCIICPIHGEFWQNPINHTRRGDGCLLCGYGVTRESWERTTEDFIKDAKIIHGDKYDYSKVRYVNNRTNVVISCPIHGDFEQTPASHLMGRGCVRCHNREVSDTVSFIAKARRVHGDKYDYSKVEYINNHTKVIINCLNHGDFMQTPNCHLNGQGCPSCKRAKQRRESVFGVAINDSSDSTDRHIYSLWYGIITRCYYPNPSKGSECYKGCQVCDDWLIFSNFEKWVIEQNVDFVGKYQIDKDLFSENEKIYSPSTCCFLPNKINTLIRNSRKRKNGFPAGVYEKGKEKYGTNYNDKTFPTIEEAYNEYVQEKTNVIHIAAKEAYERGEISEKIYNALLNYKIKGNGNI